MGTGRLGQKPTPEEGKGEGGLLERPFLSPSRFQTLFYVSWRLSGDPGSGAKTLADSSRGPSGDQRSAGGRTPHPSPVARVPQSWEFGVALCADLSPLQPVKTRIPGAGRPCFLFSLLPPPNLSETFENKILFVPPPIITQLWTVDVQCLMARRAGRGWRREGRGCPPEDTGVSANNLPAVCLSLAGFIPAWTPSQRIGGLGVVMGEGAGAAGFPRTFRKPPARRGKGAK